MFLCVHLSWGLGSITSKSHCRSLLQLFGTSHRDPSFMLVPWEYGSTGAKGNTMIQHELLCRSVP